MKLLSLKHLHGIRQMMHRYGDVEKPKTGHTRPRLQPARWHRRPPSAPRTQRTWLEELCAPVYLRQHSEF